MSVVENPPVRFRRAAGMQPLPVPMSSGSVETLRSFLNVQSAITREQQAELSLLQARRDLVTVRINLHTALGGPWTRSLGTSVGSPEALR